MNNPISVSTLNVQIKSLLETTFIQVYVEGEISNLTYHNSGHIYFSIKDESSTLSCVMFKGNTKYLKFQLENGQKVVINGNITVYAPRGNYQLLCNKIEPSGQGALAFAFEQLKNKLEAKGYFDGNYKQPLPKYPKKIALVTSPTGAAIEDMKKVAMNRWPLVEFILVPTLVQGEGAAFDIANSIKYADKLHCDIMIVGRGGGSIEDLWAFNEEPVIEAIYRSELPIISAVGHEIDNLISDLVADRRAATPTQAAEILIPLKSDLIAELDSRKNTLNKFLQNKLNIMKKDIERQKESYYLRNFMTKITDKKMELIHKEAQLNKELKYKVEKFSEKFEIVKARFNRLDLQENIALKKNQLEVKESLLSKMITESILSEKRGIEYKKAIISKYSIDEILKQGYTLTRKNGKVVRSGKGLQKGDIIQTRFIDGEVESIIQE